MDSYPLPPRAGRDFPDENRFPWQRAVTLILVCIVALYFLWRVRDVLPPFLIAFFLASLLDPVVNRLQRRGVSRIRAVLTIYAAVFLVILLIAVRLIPPALSEINDLYTNIDKYTLQFTRTADQVYERYHGVFEIVGVKNNPFREERDKTARPASESAAPQPQTHAESGPPPQNPTGADPLGAQKPSPTQGKEPRINSQALAKAAGLALEIVRGTIMGLAGKVIWLVIIPLSLFYFLMDYQALRRRLISLAPIQHQANVDRISDEIVEVFSAYMRSLAIVCALYGMAAVALFYLLGLKYALFLGLGAGVLYAVPYLGPALAIGGAGAIAATTDLHVLGFTGISVSPLVYAGIVVGLLVCMQLAFDYGITPRLVGGSVGLHPIVNIFALMCGATLFGVWGMLLAVPVAASVQIVLLYFFPKLDSRKPPSEPVAEPQPALLS